MDIGLRLQVGQVMLECTLEDVHYAPDILDDVLKRLGQSLATALMTVQTLEIPVNPYGTVGFTADCDEH